MGFDKKLKEEAGYPPAWVRLISGIAIILPQLAVFDPSIHLEPVRYDHFTLPMLVTELPFIVLFLEWPMNYWYRKYGFTGWVYAKAISWAVIIVVETVILVGIAGLPLQQILLLDVGAVALYAFCIIYMIVKRRSGTV